MWQYLYTSYTSFFLSLQTHDARFSNLISSAKCLTFGPDPVSFQESKACSRLLLRIRLSSLILRNFASPRLQMTIVSELELMIFHRIPAEGAALHCFGIAPGKCFSAVFSFLRMRESRIQCFIRLASSSVNSIDLQWAKTKELAFWSSYSSNSSSTSLRVSPPWKAIFSKRTWKTCQVT